MIAPASRNIGKYEIRQKLGRGGMGDVYLAHDNETGGTVALKLIEHSEDSDTRDSIEAERRGAELQARLADVDSRVVRIFDCGDAEGYFYVSMEYVDGQDLAEWLRRGPVIPEFAADTAIAVAHTLEHAHSLEASIGGRAVHGIVHGDIKPKNIRIDARGEVRVLDFGIAKALSLSRRLTRNDFGSVSYASPERLDTGEVSAASDLWSLLGDAVRDGDGRTAVSRRDHRTAGADDPRANSTAASAGPVSRAAARDSDEGARTRAGIAVPIGARVGGRSRGVSRGRHRPGQQRRSRGDAPDAAPRGAGRDAPHHQAGRDHQRNALLECRRSSQGTEAPAACRSAGRAPGRP